MKLFLIYLKELSGRVYRPYDTDIVPYAIIIAVDLYYNLPEWK